MRARRSCTAGGGGTSELTDADGGEAVDEDGASPNWRSIRRRLGETGASRCDQQQHQHETRAGKGLGEGCQVI